MIRYYTYYSCGGYKDLFIGSDVDQVDASYFIPLINVWKKNDKPENAEKIARAENVRQVQIITKNESAGFPSECSLMFSHGGYIAIYRTLIDGRTCLCIRDISNGLTDEEGRFVPFNFLFLADGKESIARLDTLALSYLKDRERINNSIAQSISYDHVINGVKFDLKQIGLLFTNRSEEDVAINHKKGVVDFMIIGSRKQYVLALSEQGIKENQINAYFDESGLFHGKIDYCKGDSQDITEQSESLNIESTKEDKPECVVEGQSTDKHTESSLIKQNINDTTNTDKAVSIIKPDNGTSEDNIEDVSSPDFEAIIDTRVQKILDAISVLSSKSDSEKIYSTLNKLSIDNQERANEILSAIKMGDSVRDTLPVVSSDKISLDNLIHNKNIIIALISLIVGLVLGALIS